MSHSAPPASALPAGTLFLMPAPLDFGCEPPAPLEAALPRLAIETAARLAFWVSENARSTRAFLKRVNAIAPLAQPLQAVQIAELPRAAHKQGDHAGGGGARFDARALLAPALAGHDMALISEAGLPAVADPGSSIVRAAHEAGVPVQPLAGPSSLLLALAASGLNGQSFAFNGYLPQEAAARARRIRELEALALKTGQTQLFIETPYRNAALLHALAHTLQPATRLSVSQGLTLPAARCRTLPASAWRQLGADAAPGREPAIFAIGL
ncbi:SAM-dependent methyltransferase [Ottowia massiliensis]|uniref:SAM-dependent methyltransferase n=1 Tax=Ottowia massiliensis TaxID=2045302 RepID=UPI000C85F676|nr:SAM-dependent methyltransferase [Ottowia massiliensis]